MLLCRAHSLQCISEPIPSLPAPSCLDTQAAEKRHDLRCGKEAWFLKEGREDEFRVRMRIFVESEWFGYLLTCFHSCRGAPGTDCYSCGFAYSTAGRMASDMGEGGLRVERQSKAGPWEQAKRRGE
jgi:hypothetical protein